MIRTQVKTDHVTRTKSQQEFGGKGRYSLQKTTESVDTSKSFVTIKDYEVNSVQKETDPQTGEVYYRVDLDARQGIVLRK